MRTPGEMVFSAGALIMSWDFLMKLRTPSGARGVPLVQAAVAAE